MALKAKDNKHRKNTPQIGNNAPQIGKNTPQIGKNTPQIGESVPAGAQAASPREEFIDDIRVSLHQMRVGQVCDSAESLRDIRTALDIDATKLSACHSP